MKSIFVVVVIAAVVCGLTLDEQWTQYKVKFCKNKFA